MTKLIGYMRVSTKEQDNQLQYDALIKAGVLDENIFRDKITGTAISRAGLDKCLLQLSSGDTFVVWKLDRLGRGTVHLIQLVESLVENNINFKSLTEAWDTSTPMGKAMFRIGCVFAELEKETIKMRIKAGIKAKMNAGRKRWGKLPQTDYNESDIVELADQGMTQRDVAKMLGISKDTVGRVLKKIDALSELI